MDQLTWFALSQPRKLPRIGEFLGRKVARALYRQQTQLVKVGVQAFVRLLQACHSSLGLFVEHFLRTLDILLEARNSEIQLLGLGAFIKFAQIEEETPSSHRRYDFFVQKFCSLCYLGHGRDNENLRIAALQSLRALFRKTMFGQREAVSVGPLSVESVYLVLFLTSLCCTLFFRYICNPDGMCSPFYRLHW